MSLSDGQAWEREYGKPPVVGRIEFAPPPTKNWDSIARRYVEHDTEPQETLPDGVLLNTPVAVGAIPRANDNVEVFGVGMRGAAELASKSLASVASINIPASRGVSPIPEDVRVAANMAFNSTFTKDGCDVYAALEKAILAERKRCSVVARAEGDAAKANGNPQAALGAYWASKSIMGVVG